MNYLETFNPLLNAALERYQHFNRPEPRDLLKIFGPTLATIANLAGADPNRATEIISTWDPAAVTAETLRAAVTEITKPTMDEMLTAKTKQVALEEELSKPLTARERVLMERVQTPIEQRSRQSILDELFEANSGRTRDGVKLPQIDARHWKALEPHFVALEQELEKRDCALAGIPYSGPPVKRNVVMAGYGMGPQTL